jgi:hypothetical protein
VNLCFDALDRHVIAGRAEDPALRDDEVAWSVARLLEETAALGGAMRGLGVTPGDRVAVDAERPRTRLVAALAALRLGAVPVLDGDRAGAALLLAPTAPAADDPVPAVLVEGDDPAAVVVGTRDLPLAVALRAGRTDPAPAVDALPDHPAYVVGETQAHEPEAVTELGRALADLLAGREVDLRRPPV